MSKLILGTFFLFLFGVARGQLNQTCNHLELVTPNHFFEVDKVTGTWYSIELFSSLAVDATPLTAKCIEDSMVQTPDGIALTERYTTLDSSELIENTYSVSLDNEWPARWTIAGPDRETGTVWLQTDNENWAVQYLCNIEDNYRYERLHFLSRERTIDPKTLEILQIVASGYGFPAANGRLVDQSDC